MIKVSDLSNWFIQFQGLTADKTPLQCTTTASSFSFKVPFNITEVIECTFPINHNSEAILEGKYTVFPSGYTSKSVLKVVEEGKALRVFLSGDLSRFSFQLKRTS
ncbi:MAG: hypothetical protein KBA81_01035 [Rhabdochlamydiaceae bacterium]|nr:hypothetical protein [Rhabdochlamydiaceae bacterium]